MKTNVFRLDKNTSIKVPDVLTSPVKYALDMLIRDMEKVFGQKPEVCANKSNTLISIEYASKDDEVAQRPEAYAIRFSESAENGAVMHVVGSDDLGVVYGILHISGKYLEVDPFWFWADKEPSKKEFVDIPMTDFLSPTPRVRFRGWFVNDEVCLIGWTDIYPPPKEVWYPVFEALLRCGGNMVIPGTDLPRNGIHYELASEMGLWITHHHAEPLGAEMFLRAYPNEKAIYSQNSHLFEKLWREAIEKNKDKKVVWVLGFRGQGDGPFWSIDTSYKTNESRGELISKVIERQYEMLCEYVDNPVCSAYCYAENAELYKEGYLKFPNGIIKIWSDNGYGKMVSRRRGNHNPRVPSLPLESDEGPHGLYYHVTFHDLQASSHLTMLGNSPQLIKDELKAAFAAGADEYLLVNCGNIRPHIYTLDVVRELWEKGDVDLEKHSEEFGKRYFSSNFKKAMECYSDYFKSTIKYGVYDDDRAGDEFYHHPLRALASQWIKGDTTNGSKSLHWATGAVSFEEQIKWFRDKCVEAQKNWEALLKKSEDVAQSLSENERTFFADNLQLQIKLHLSGCKGFIAFCDSFAPFKENNYVHAFIILTRAMRYYHEGVEAMQNAEHDHWKNFYRADWLTNVKCTIYTLESLRRYIRVLGDSPHFFTWYKYYIMPETERNIYLENTQRRTLGDDDLAKLLEEKLKI